MSRFAKKVVQGKESPLRGWLFPSLLLVAGTICILFAGWNIHADNVDSREPYVEIPTVALAATPALESTAVAEPEILYPVRPKLGAKVGSLSIPVLKQKFPIIEGTEDAQLKRGVGHYVRSVLPGEVDNCVLAGHRDTVFTELGKLKIGDDLVVATSVGSFTYRIRKIRIVDKDDRTVIVPTETAVLTISTCYPFHYVGHAPKRYILVADLVNSQLN